MKQSENIADAATLSRLDPALRQLASLTDSRDRLQGSRSATAEDIGTALPQVLLIDDDGAYRSELSRYLRSNGFDSLESDSFAAAFEIVRASPGACVIVPELTVGSRHLFDYIAQMKRASGASVLVLSGRREETEKIVALEVGADDFIAEDCRPARDPCPHPGGGAAFAGPLLRHGTTGVLLVPDTASRRERGGFCGPGANCLIPRAGPSALLPRNSVCSRPSSRIPDAR